MDQPFADAAKTNNCFGASRSANDDRDSDEDGAPCFHSISAVQKQERVV